MEYLQICWFTAIYEFIVFSLFSKYWVLWCNNFKTVLKAHTSCIYLFCVFIVVILKSIANLFCIWWYFLFLFQFFIVLEVVWPILIFVVLVGMRTGFPQDSRVTCKWYSKSRCIYAIEFLFPIDNMQLPIIQDN